MPNYRRRVVRFIWDFCKKPVAATKLGSTRRWFKNYYPEVGHVLVELIGKEGNIYVRFNWNKHLPCVESSEVVKLLSAAKVFPTNTSPGLFKGVMSRRKYTGYNEIQVSIEPVNGEHFTLTAMKRCKTLFEFLDMDIKEANVLPLVGNFTQDSYAPTGYYMDFGTHLYFEVFENMPLMGKMPEPETSQAS